MFKDFLGMTFDGTYRQATTVTKPLKQTKTLYQSALERVRNRLHAHGIKVESAQRARDMEMSGLPQEPEYRDFRTESPTTIKILKAAMKHVEQRSFGLNPTTLEIELKTIHPQQKSLGQTEEIYDLDVIPISEDEVATPTPELKKEWEKIHKHRLP